MFAPYPAEKPRPGVSSDRNWVCLDDGMVRIDTFSWDAYNESIDLIKQVDQSETKINIGKRGVLYLIYNEPVGDGRSFNFFILTGHVKPNGPGS